MSEDGLTFEEMMTMSEEELTEWFANDNGGVTVQYVGESLVNISLETTCVIEQALKDDGIRGLVVMERIEPST